jgi:hypothetical protein
MLEAEGDILGELAWRCGEGWRLGSTAARDDGEEVKGEKIALTGRDSREMCGRAEVMG